MVPSILFLSLIWLQLSFSYADYANDFSILKSLQQSFNSPSTLKFWSGSDPCKDGWTGVTCSNPTCISSLQLSDLQLEGTLPSNLFEMSCLNTIDLSLNPGIYGSLPAVSSKNLPLSSINFENCSLSGSIPPSISYLSSLYFFQLNRNNLSGEIPYELSNLTQMVWFDISENSISGSIPDLSNMQNLRHIHFQGNRLSGSIPTWIKNATTLFHILLDNNQLTGVIPKEIFSLPVLAIISLSENNFDATNITTLLEDSYMQDLVEISMAKCNLFGQLPDLSGFSKLKLLNLSLNNFRVPFPPVSIFSNSTSLDVIDLSNNYFSGSVPDLTFLNLTILDIQNNSLSGIDLKLLGAGFNELPKVLLSGNEICNGSNLAAVLQVCSPSLNLAWEPSILTNCAQKQCDDGFQVNPFIYYATNNPGVSCDCSSPLNVTLLFGHFSLGIFYDQNAQSIQSQVTSTLNQLYSLNMQLNQTFVAYFNLLSTGYYELLLQFYPTSGELSDSVVNDVKSLFSTHSVFLGDGLNPYIVGGYAGPLEPSTSKNYLAIILVSVFVPLVIFLIICLSLFAFWERRKAKKERKEKLERQRLRIEGLRKFNLQEIKKHTNDFDPHLELGSGAYGKVFKMVMKLKDESKILEFAVKRSLINKKALGAVADTSSSEGAMAFFAELQLLSRVHHRNLIDLIGYCTDEKEEILVYPFLPYGTVEQHLKGRFAPSLNWNERLKICLGSARGLTYLHNNAQPPIIHRDIKSSNILLDENLEPKVADFGISFARTLEKREDNLIKGTKGYLDPEYLETGEATFKSDVYSFGVLLLEIMTARKPFGYYTDKDADKPSYPDTIQMDIEEHSFSFVVDKSMGDYPVDGLAAIMNLAFQCVRQEGLKRPPMQQVAYEIETICRHFGEVEDGEETFVKIRQIFRVNNKDSLYQPTVNAAKIPIEEMKLLSGRF